MLFDASKFSFENTAKYLIRLPLMKQTVHKLNEATRGKFIVFFSLHRVLGNNQQLATPPNHLLNGALSIKQLEKILKEIKQVLKFIPIKKAIDKLLGNTRMLSSYAVLLIEVPYKENLRLIKPLLQELQIPACLILSSNEIVTGNMPWTDEIKKIIFNTEKKHLSLDYLDRSFPLVTMRDKEICANYLIDSFSFCTPLSLKKRLAKLRDLLENNNIIHADDKILSIHELKKLQNFSLFSFAYAGNERLPFFSKNEKEFENEVRQTKEIFDHYLNSSMTPLFYYPWKLQSPHKVFTKILMSYGFSAAMIHNDGVCRPGDNMFQLNRIDLKNNANSFLEYELYGLRNAIDEFLLVTLAKEKKY